MNIQLNYQAKAETLANASLIFLERKWLFWFSIYFFNTLSVLLSSILVIKFILIREMTYQEILALCIGLFWLFGRRPLTQKILSKRMKQDLAVTKGTSLTLSRNGISWGGQGVKEDSLQWAHIPYVIRVFNGYIIPARITRFIWIPDEAFTEKNQRKSFEAYAKEMKIKIKRVKRYC